MNIKTEKQLELIKREVREMTLEMDMPTATEFVHELAEWAYQEYENCIIDDEPDVIEEY